MENFLETLHQKGGELYRDMPWRRDTRPYYVLVSELMLQQTQVDRVVPKFNAFIDRFPDISSLANASLSDVITLWSGLGYNRRAKFLYESAKRVLLEYEGLIPDTKAELLTLPGVGEGTAGAILVYAFNNPTIFVETNVRSVYLHHFFLDGEKVSDAQITTYIEQTIDKEHPREFYWALMDYGSWLKKRGVGHITQSKQYIKQSQLKGSVREVRGIIVRLLVGVDMTVEEIMYALNNDTRVNPAINGLIQDGLIEQTGEILHLTK